MAATTIDEYLADVPEPKRTTLQRLRATIREIVPAATEAISYGMPAFKIDGKVVAGFAAFKHHLAYFPHSGGPLRTLATELAGYEQTPGSLHFAIDRPLPKTLVRKLIAARRAEIAEAKQAAQAKQAAKRVR